MQKVTKLTDKITDYLAGLFSSGLLTEQQASQTAGLMYVLGDVERIGNLSAGIALSMKEKKQTSINIHRKRWMNLQNV